MIKPKIGFLYKHYNNKRIYVVLGLPLRKGSLAESVHYKDIKSGQTYNALLVEWQPTEVDGKMTERYECVGKDFTEKESV